MRKEKRTVVVTIRLGESVVRGLRELAEQDRRKLANYVAMVLEDHLAERQHDGNPPKRKE
jgi:hypothetical protein